MKLVTLPGLVLLSFNLANPSLAVAASIKVTVLQISFICATPANGLPDEVRRVVADLMRSQGEKGVAQWGDRAVAVQLDGGGDPEYLLPLTCGATGYCNWAVLAVSPVRRLGVLGGSVLEIRSTGRGWAAIDGYSGYGAGEGDLTEFLYRDGTYHKGRVGKLTPEAVGRYQSCVDNDACCPKPSNLTTG